MEKSILVENAIAAVKNMVKVVEDRVAINNLLAKEDDKLVGYEKDYSDVMRTLAYISDNAESEDAREMAEHILGLLDNDVRGIYTELTESPGDVDSVDVDILNAVAENISAIECPELTEIKD